LKSKKKYENISRNQLEQFVYFEPSKEFSDLNSANTVCQSNEEAIFHQVVNQVFFSFFHFVPFPAIYASVLLNRNV